MPFAEWIPSAPRISRRALLGALAGVALAGCAPRRPSDPTIDDMAGRYVRTALQLAQHQPRLVDGWLGPAEWSPGARVPVAGLAAELERLLTELEPIAASDPDHSVRARYLLGQVRGLYLAARRLLGQSMPLALEAQVAFGMTMPPVDVELVASAREALESRLPGTGPLGARLAAFRRRESVPAARVGTVFARALSICREATRAALPLPDDERVEVVSVAGMPWDAFCRYQGGRLSRLEINQGGAFPVSRLFRLAAHEAYPGHHVQHVITDTALVEGRDWVEFALQPAFGPHLLLAEGAAEVGVDLVAPDQDRARIYTDDLLPMAGLSPDMADTMVSVERLSLDIEPVIPEIIGAYLDGGAGADDTVARLADETLVADPRAFLSFAERQRSTLYAYPAGRLIVEQAIMTEGPSRGWERLSGLYGSWMLL